MTPALFTFMGCEMHKNLGDALQYLNDMLAHGYDYEHARHAAICVYAVPAAELDSEYAEECLK